MLKKRASDLIEALRQKAVDQESSGGETPNLPAAMGIRDCPHCGAGRAQGDGLTHCAYCGFEFIATQLSDGIHLTSKENS